MQRTLFALTLTGLTTFATQGLAKTTPCTIVKSGSAMGPFKLGAKKADVLKAGAKQGPMSSMLKKGPYSLYFNKKEQLNQVELEIPGSKIACIQIGKKQLSHRDAKESFAMAFSDCRRFEPRTGGNVSTCKSGAMVTQHMGGFSIRVVEPETTTKEPSCDGYIAMGQLVAASKTSALSKKRKMVELKIQENKNYCVSGTVLPSTLAPDEIVKKYRFDSCRKQANRGATTVDCPYDGVRFIFAGPKLAWHSAQVYPAKKPTH